MADLAAAAKSLRRSISGLSRTFSAMSREAAKAAKSSTAILFGMGGGFIGLGAAYAVSLWFPMASLALLSSFLSGGGIVGGVLVFRGGKRISAENRLDMLRVEREALLAEIKSLPRSAPASARQALWDTYAGVVEISKAETLALSNSTRPARSQAPPALPPS